MYMWYKIPSYWEFGRNYASIFRSSVEHSSNLAVLKVQMPGWLTVCHLNTVLFCTTVQCLNYPGLFNRTVMRGATSPGWIPPDSLGGTVIIKQLGQSWVIRTTACRYSIILEVIMQYMYPWYCTMYVWRIEISKWTEETKSWSTEQVATPVRLRHPVLLTISYHSCDLSFLTSTCAFSQSVIVPLVCPIVG